MKQFVYGALVATAVLGAAGFAVMKEPVAGAAKRNVPLKLSDLTLDRAFRINAMVGTAATPSILTATTQGFVITEVLAPQWIGYTDVSVSINGASPESYSTNTATSRVVFRSVDPPIIVRPGDAIAFWQGSTNPVPYTIAGYFVYPGEV